MPVQDPLVGLNSRGVVDFVRSRVMISLWALARADTAMMLLKRIALFIGWYRVKENPVFIT